MRDWEKCRKQVLAKNEETWIALSESDKNLYNTCGIVSGVSTAAVDSGENYHFPRRIPKWFSLAEDFDLFQIHKRRGSQGSSKIRRIDSASSIWWIYGWRGVITFFNENVLIDLTRRLDINAPEREDAISRIISVLSESYSVDIIGDARLVDVRRKEI